MGADRPDEHVARLVQRTALAAGLWGDLPEGERRLTFAGHSLCVGLATAADVEKALVQRRLGHAFANTTRGPASDRLLRPDRIESEEGPAL
jgi:hypothetical protein